MKLLLYIFKFIEKASKSYNVQTNKINSNIYEVFKTMTQITDRKPNAMERLMIPVHNCTNIGAEKVCYCRCIYCLLIAEHSTSRPGRAVEDNIQSLHI